MFRNFWRWKRWYFWAKKLIEIWYLLITENFLFWCFWKLEIRSFLVLNFSVMGNTVFFFQQKSWWKDHIYMVFSSFLWYSRTWEIWFFVQWNGPWIHADIVRSVVGKSKISLFNFRWRCWYKKNARIKKNHLNRQYSHFNRYLTHWQYYEVFKCINASQQSRQKGLPFFGRCCS